MEMETAEEINKERKRLFCEKRKMWKKSGREKSKGGG